MATMTSVDLMINTTSSPGARSSSVAASLVMAVVGYYATDLARGVYRTVEQTGAHAKTFTDWHSALMDLGFWSVLAVVSGLPLGLVGWGTHRRGLTGLACQLAVPAAAAEERRVDERRSRGIQLDHASRIPPCSSGH